jgi:hypothetical protein
VKLATEDPGHAIDMGQIVRFLMAGDNHPDGRPGPQLKPWEIWELTLAEIAWMLSEPGPGTPCGRQPMGDLEIAAYAEWFNGLTPLELLEASQRGEVL